MCSRSSGGTGGVFSAPQLATSGLRRWLGSPHRQPDTQRDDASSPGPSHPGVAQAPGPEVQWGGKLTSCGTEQGIPKEKRFRLCGDPQGKQGKEAQDAANKPEDKEGEKDTETQRRPRKTARRRSQSRWRCGGAGGHLGPGCGGAGPQSFLRSRRQSPPPPARPPSA